MNAIYRNLNDFISLFFPEVCAACGSNLVSNESVICTGCVLNLPYTDFHLHPDNRLAKQFWGRVPFVHCNTYLYFSKGSKVQNLMHQLKYNNRPEVGFKLGEMFGKKLNAIMENQKPDVIIPIPLHPGKEKKRGYNQSEHFALGLSAALSIPTKNSIYRSVATETQTRKSRFVRYENMKDVFLINNIQDIQNKHVLIVDDIITTGATIESCANKILEISGTRVSIAGIAFTY